MKVRGQKFQFSNFLVNREKFRNAIFIQKSQFPISFMNWEKLENIHSPRPTFQNPNVNLWVSWETFTVENKMGNSHKRGWSHFKLNIND